jgi:hypothetical protein
MAKSKSDGLVETALVIISFFIWFYLATIILSIYFPLDTAIINF